MATTVFNQSTNVFSFNVVPPTGILPLQLADPNSPAPSSVISGTNLLVPDEPSAYQLRNFPEEVYDLRDTSHLVRLMRAFLGDAGAGQLRKRVLLCRLEAALTGANFFDIDRFYGAIFGALRTSDEQLPINPMNDTATPDEWDAIYAADTEFRERIMLLAKGISMGGTPEGIKACAQAIVSAPVDIYETWQLLDAYGPGYVAEGNTWAEVEAAYPYWDSFAPLDTWNLVEGVVHVGRLPVATRGEIIVRPHKNYAGLDPSVQEVDGNAIMRVLQKMKPASTIVTFAPDGNEINIPIKVGGLQADSNYWEVIKNVTPNPTISNLSNVYPLSTQQSNAGVDPLSTRTLPVPPFSQGQGVSWSVNASITNVSGYTRTYQTYASAAPQWVVSPIPEQAVVNFPDGTVITYPAQNGVLDAQQAAAASITSDGSLVCHPYSGDRVQVSSHT